MYVGVAISLLLHIFYLGDIVQRAICIYVLRDPRSSKIRYVGKTVQKLNNRLTSHVREAKRENNSHKDRWILQVIRAGYKPIIEKIEDVNEDNWQERERYWIFKHYGDGCKLVNETEGGEGLHGHKFSKDHRSKLGRALLGNKRWLGKAHSEETKRKMSDGKKGKDNPNYGKEFSAEHRGKLSEAHKGQKHTTETKHKMSSTAKGNQYARGYKQTDEHRQKLLEARFRVCIHCEKKVKRTKRGSNIYTHRHNGQRECERMTTSAE